MRKVKWGVLGCAGFARGTSVPAMLKSEHVELLAVASRDAGRAADFAGNFGIPRAYGSYDRLLADADVEAVYIPLPNGLHAEWSIRAVEAGKHVYVEKPYAANVEEAERMADASRKCGRHISEAFMWRFHPMHLRARSLIRDGAVGDLKFVRSAFTFMIARKPNVRLDPQLAGGGVMDVGCYCICAARFLFGEEPLRAFVSAEIDPEYGVDMLASGLLEFPGGCATFHGGFASSGRCDYEAVGTRGRILAQRAFLPPDPCELIGETTQGELKETFTGINQYTIEFEEFSRSIVEGSKPAYDAEDAVKQQRVIDAVMRSIRTGKPENV
jgi:predicted dehydrogenase